MFTRPRSGKYEPPFGAIAEVCYPKTRLADRAFGLIDPEIHSDIALEICSNWTQVLDRLFDADQRVHSYSFPIPVSAAGKGRVSTARSGRLIYEWLEMAEAALVEEAPPYKYLLRTDVKSFYPSVYTHSISWAIHTKKMIRQGKNRTNWSFFGNRVDKLFQRANDGCTNGIPVGPVVSDLVAELVLSAVDLELPPLLGAMGVVGLRFKDDYRFLCSSEEDCRRLVRALQAALKGYNLLLNEEKTTTAELPEGVFRPWVSRYHQIRPPAGQKLTYRDFRELYLGVLQIDRDVPGTGLIDRFLADLTDKEYAPLFPVNGAHAGEIVSLLLLLSRRRLRSLPGVLGLLEAMRAVSHSPTLDQIINARLGALWNDVSRSETQNCYAMAWILYFLASNKMGRPRVPSRCTDWVVRSVGANRMALFRTAASEFHLFRSIASTRKAGPMLQHLEVFPRSRGPASATP